MTLMSFKAQGLVLQSKSMTIMFLIFRDPLYGPLHKFGNANFIRFAFDNLLQALHNYFAHSYKKHLEFTKLVEIMEMKGKKIFQNVKTRWMSILGLAKE